MITENQRESRRKFLGSSDAPALVGVNPWKNAADLYWEKIRPPSENKKTSTNDAVIIGNFCEDAVLEWFSQTTGKKIVRNQRRVHPNGIMAANFDALVIGEEEAVEAKTAGIVSRLDENWGEIETDEIPEHVIVQVQHQMSVLPTVQVVWVPVLMGGVGFRKYRVERNQAFIDDLEKLEVNFWHNHIEKLVPPDDLPTIETIKKIRRVPKKTVALQDDLVSNWQKTRAASSIAEKEKDEALRLLLGALGDAEEGFCSLGSVTYYEQTTKERIVPASTYRVARFKAKKEEK